jgi:hypothetical protein
MGGLVVQELLLGGERELGEKVIQGQGGYSRIVKGLDSLRIKPVRWQDRHEHLAETGELRISEHGSITAMEEHDVPSTG